MIERYIQALHTDDPGAEEPAATRERLKGGFAPGAVRRMTQLGLLVGAAVGRIDPTSDDAVVYASAFGETRTLAAFLDSFPAASPTLFQTSIHPSGVQQVLIGRQRSVREFFPLSGGPYLAGQAMLTAAQAGAPRVVVCGGEECGGWMAERGVASARAFAFALSLTPTPGVGALGRLTLAPTEETGGLTLEVWFDILHRRLPFSGPVTPGWRLQWEWS